MIILEGRKDMYMPVKQLGAASGEAKIYICENQSGEKSVSKIYSDMKGLDGAVRKYLYICDNPFVLGLKDYGVTEVNGTKCAFEIYPYISEGTWAEKAPVDAYEVETRIIPCLNEGLHQIHEAGFLHRDIKPDNLYVTKDTEGNDGVLIGDFGISVQMDGEGQCCDTALAFTPGYVPAEVLGSNMYSAASDYYAVAVTIYYLLTGHQIFEGMTPDEIMLKTRRGELMNYDAVDKHIAALLEGLTVQDPRYRWGYQEVRQWLQGANVPVFRYTQEEQVLDPPYLFTSRISCHSLRELSESLATDPEEGIRHLYDGLISDGVRRQYPYLSNGLTELIVNQFPHARNAGLTAAMKLIYPEVRGFFWYGTRYSGLDELLKEVRTELARGETPPSTEELLGSGILSYYYGELLTEDDRNLLKLVERTAIMQPVQAQATLVLNLLPKPVYQIGEDICLESVSDYIDYLQENNHAVRSLLEKDFNKTYFRTFVEACGYREAFKTWINYFYGGGRVRDNEQLIGNVCQFLGEICPEKLSVLKHFVLTEIKNSPEYWLKDHLDLYEMDEMMSRMVHQNFDHVVFTGEMTLQDMLREQHKMKECMNELRRDLMNNYALLEQGVYDTAGYRILTHQADGLFVMHKAASLVPVGWLRETQGIIGRNEIQEGFAQMRQDADLHMQQMADQAEQWAAECENEVKEKKKARKNPGIIGGIITVLLAVLALLNLVELSQSMMQECGMLSLVGFVAAFFMAVLWLIGGLRRFVKVFMWHSLVKSPAHLKAIAEEIRSRSTEYTVKNIGELKISGNNLETEAQVERAAGCNLLSDYKLKNGLLRYMILFLLASMLLMAGFLQDGTLTQAWQVITHKTASVVEHNTEENQTKETQADVYYVKSSAARLRSGPGTDYDTLNSYENGTEMTATGKKQSDSEYYWYEVIAPDGTTGWMREDMLKK